MSLSRGIYCRVEGSNFAIQIQIIRKTKRKKIPTTQAVFNFKACRCVLLTQDAKHTLCAELFRDIILDLGTANCDMPVCPMTGYQWTSLRYL